MEAAYSDGLIGVELSSNSHDQEEQELVDVDLDASIGKETGIQPIKKSSEGSERSHCKKTMLASAFIMALLEQIVPATSPNRDLPQ